MYHKRPVSLSRLHLLAGAAPLGMSAVCLAQAVGAPDIELLKRFVPELSDPQVGFTLSEQARKGGREEGLGYRFEGDINSDGVPDRVLLGRSS